MSSAQTLIRKVDPKTASGPAMKAFLRIADRWKLDVDKQLTLLGAPARSTFFRWKKGQDVNLSMDTLERISYMLGIFKALHILLPDEDAADAWINKPNTAPLFAGKSALDRMLSGHVSDLYEVRRYLDAQRGGWA
ncbi:MAG TPA: MbcA/ParS/Xre antitoxin family protein [Elusimicrobiota bacterium]|nr:MbcA/ParS/Xre antitoxin family protein [Elusimicrobiota bacterium]